MQTYALVSAESIVENVVIWDGDTSIWSPPAGQTAVEVTAATGAAYIGGTYAEGVFETPTIS